MVHTFVFVMFHTLTRQLCVTSDIKKNGVNIFCFFYFSSSVQQEDDEPGGVCVCFVCVCVCVCVSLCVCACVAPTPLLQDFRCDTAHV